MLIVCYESHSQVGMKIIVDVFTAANAKIYIELF